MKEVFFVENRFEEVVGVVVVLDSTTAQEVQDTIDEVKTKKSDCSYDDILEALPKDCLFYRVTKDNVVRA